MTRALTETILDPIIVIYSMITNIENNSINENLHFGLYYGINIFLSIIMDFCSCVYNDFVVLYCCGLEYNTYREVSKRGLLNDENHFVADENSSSSDEEDDAELKIIDNSKDN